MRLGLCEAPMNIVVLAGSLSRPPEVRELPSGDPLVTYEVTVRYSGQRAESVPVVWFDAPRSAVSIEAHETVVVTGRVRRRFFRSGGATASRTEVVATTVVPTRHRKRARRAVEQAVAPLGDLEGPLDLGL